MPSDRMQLKIPNINSPEKAGEFLQYLRMELEKFGDWRGHGQRQQDGSFVSRVECQIGNDAGELTPTTWEFVWAKNESLSSISVEAPSESPGWWNDGVNSAYQSALASALSADKTKFFRRHQFAYIGTNLDGEYWIAGWRIAPAIPDDEIQFLDERIVFLDHWTEAVDLQQAGSIARVKADKIMVLLSLFSGIGFYRIPIEGKWVITGDNESKRYQLGYRHGTPSPDEMPKKGTEGRPGKYVPFDRRNPESTPTNGQLPDDTRELFRAFENLSQSDQLAFFGAAALYHIAITVGRHHPSVSLSYQIAAVEVLREHGKTPLEGTIELVRKYNPQISDEFIKQLYGKVRSAHFHEGQFPLGEFEPMLTGPLMDPGNLSRMELQMVPGRILQPTIIDWLLEHTKKPN